MHILPGTFFLWVLNAVFAYPLKRTVAADIQVLAFANVLEQLESAFYTQALKQFNASNFQDAGFASSQIPIQQIRMIASDENVHEQSLQSTVNALGGRLVTNCTFNFSSALTDVNAMVATARMVENVGVSAYLGALSSLSNPELVTVAGSILTIEARHQTIVNLLSNARAIPQPFDIALTPGDVLAIAGGFISGCKLGFSANPPLTVTNNGPLQAGTKLNFSSPALNGTASQLSCKIVTGGLNAPLYQPLDGCMIPANVSGPMYVFITQDQMAKKSPSHASWTTNSRTIITGPALLFVNQADFIGGLIRPGFNTSGATTRNTSSTVPATTTVSTWAYSTTSPAPVSTAAAAFTTSTPPLGTYTTTLSPGQASALLSSLASN